MVIRKETLKRVKNTTEVAVGDVVTVSSEKVVLGERRFAEGTVEEILNETLVKVRPKLLDGSRADYFEYLDIRNVLVKQKKRIERKQKAWKKNISGPPENFGVESVTDL